MSSLRVAYPNTVRRALASGGTSQSSPLFTLTREIVERRDRGGVVVDVGCGTGTLYGHLAGSCARYIGIDIVRHAGFPDASGIEFIQLNLDEEAGSFPIGLADVVCCLETIEHVENPRALGRAISQLVKPGGLVVISTPNQLSLLSKLCLVAKNEYVHFQERPGLYPAHLSALLECDLRRIANELGWTEIAIHYTADGRIPGMAAHWPRGVAAREGWRGRTFSDNVVLSARKPAPSSRESA